MSNHIHIRVDKATNGYIISFDGMNFGVKGDEYIAKTTDEVYDIVAEVVPDQLDKILRVCTPAQGGMKLEKGP